MLTNDLSKDQIIDIVADFITPIVGECEQAQVNRVPTPQDQFAILTPITFKRISTTRSNEKGEYNEVRQMDIQVDIYGEKASDRAVNLETLWSSSYAYDGITAINNKVAPLYSSDAMQSPFIDESKQWLERYIITLSLQVHITITIDQDSFNAVEITTQRV